MASLEIEKKETPVESTETMIFNISLTNWGRIFGKLFILYCFLAGYFTMLLYVGLETRGTSYLRLPSAYFGDFERNFAYPSIQTVQHRDPVIYEVNRPTGCSVSTDFAGLLECNSDDNNLWNPYPWVKETNGLGSFPATCFSEPSKDFISSTNMLTLYCSNYLSTNPSS